MPHLVLHRSLPPSGLLRREHPAKRMRSECAKGDRGRAEKGAGSDDGAAGGLSHANAMAARNGAGNAGTVGQGKAG